LPSSGVAAGPLLLNSITATNPGVGTSGSGWDSFGQIRNQINALRINYATTSTNATNNGAFSVANFVTGADESYGAALGTTINSNAAGHQTWGLIGYSTVWPGGVIHTAVGVEAEVGVSTGGSANYRIGVGANSQGPVQGNTLDAAFSASTIGNQVPGSGASSASWQHLMALSVLYGVDPASPVIAPTGDFFFSETPLTVAHFANLPNVTVTGNILSFPNATLTGAGNLNLAGTINGVTLNNAPWSTYTPSVSTGAGNGTPGMVSATGRYRQIGKTVIFQARVAINDAGSAIRGLYVSLPVNSAAGFRYAGSVSEASVTGKGGDCRRDRCDKTSNH
jgi:hypothetical protein